METIVTLGNQPHCSFPEILGKCQVPEYNFHLERTFEPSKEAVMAPTLLLTCQNGPLIITVIVM